MQGAMLRWLHLLSGIPQRNNVYATLLILLPPQECANLPHSQQIIMISVMLRDTTCPNTCPQQVRTNNNFFLSQAYLKINFYFQPVSSLTLRRLMSYIYGAPILDVSRSHTMTQHSR